MEKLPEEFNMVEIMAKVPPEERTPYVVVAFQETERMNMLTSEMRRTLKELDLGLKVRSVYTGIGGPVYSTKHIYNSAMILAILFSLKTMGVTPQWGCNPFST